MKKVRRRQLKAQQERLRKRRRTGLLIGATAAIAVLAVSYFLGPCTHERETRQQKTVQQETIKKSDVSETITFQDAVRNPRLRQRYLDQIKEKANLRCTGDIIYDPTNIKEYQYFMKRVEYYKKQGLAHLFDLEGAGKSLRNRGNQFMGTIRLPLDFKGEEKHKHPLFVGVEAFNVLQLVADPDESILDFISIHEESHACDVYDGFWINGRSFEDEELVLLMGKPDGTGRLLIGISELRAYGAQLEQYNLSDLNTATNEYNILKKFCVINFVKEFDNILMQEMHGSNALDEFDNRIPSRKEAIERIKEKSKEDTDDLRLWVARMAVLEHEDMISKIDEAEVIPWKLSWLLKLQNGRVILKYPPSQDYLK